MGNRNMFVGLDVHKKRSTYRLQTETVTERSAITA
jgi:hypothetical protein